MQSFFLFSILFLSFSIGHFAELSEDYEYEMKWNRRKATSLRPSIPIVDKNAANKEEMRGFETTSMPMANTPSAAPCIPSYSTMLPDPASMNPYLNRGEKSILLHRAYYRRMKAASIEDRIIIQAEFREKLRQIMQDKMN